MRCPNEVADNPLRIGIVDYLNSRPLAWSFLPGVPVEGLEPFFLSPAIIAESLASGELDVGLIPTIELQRIGGLSVVPGLCVAAHREVRSVLLVSRVDIHDINSLALDENSRTSAALIRIILRDLYEIDPAATTCKPDVSKMLRFADAALVIGDPALAIDRSRYLVLDLAVEWRRLTGKPFVFAVWAIRKGVDLGRRLGLFRQSLVRGLENIETLVQTAASEQSLPKSEVREYLTEHLSYRLGDDELSGLGEFFDRAFEYKLIPAVSPLRFAGSCGDMGDSVEYEI
ncbi:MAG: menaquinone biosynthesis protein [Acidobacteriota bacterium]